MPLPIQSLLPNETVRGPLLLTELTARKTRNGADYLDLKLRDATGSVPAKMWQTSAEMVAHLQPPCTVLATARVDEYQGRPQLVIEQLEAYSPTDEEYRDLIPTSAWPSELLWKEVRAHLRHEIVDQDLWTLVEAVLNRPEVIASAATIPAASRNHHAYRSGLAEHVLSMMRLSAGVIRHYEQYYPYPIHRGLLAAGILLHDIGKIWELSGEVDAQYTDEGRLLGHIFMAARWIEEVAATVNSPRAMVVELQHMILSHHGLLEYGSPKVPQTLESMLLHHIDKLDADMNQWMAELTQPGWTNYQRNYARSFFRPDEYRETWTQIGAGELGPRGPGQAVDELDAPPSSVGTFSAASEAAAPPTASSTPAPEAAKKRTKPANDASAPSADKNVVDTSSSKTLTLFDGLGDD